MKRFVKALACLLCAVLTVFAFLPVMPVRAAGTAYYIDSLNGSDETGDGLSPETAWRTVPVLDSITLQPGDRVLFRCGGVYECSLRFENCVGTPEMPILISSYGEGEKPLLTTDAQTEVMRLFDCSRVTVSGLEITAPNGGGIWIDALTRESEGITLRDLSIHNIQNHKVNDRDPLSGGAAPARACVMVKGLPARTLYPVNGLTVTGCEFYDCGNGVSLWGAYDTSLGSPWNDDEFSELGPVYNENALVENCFFHDMDAEAIIVGICKNALVTHCRMIDCCQGEGVDENGEVLYFTAAAWFWGSEYSTIEYCEIAGQKNVGDGMTVDFDSQSNHCVYQYIYSHDNVRFMCNNAKTSPQVGNVVRYCLSVNDNKGRNKLCSGPGEKEMLFYNNTIVGSQRFDFDGLYDSYFVNNIIVMEDGYRLNTDLAAYFTNGNVISDNCYYNCVSGLLAGTKYNTLPGFTGMDAEDPDSFTLCTGSPLIGTGYRMDDSCAEDFFGNPIESCNIGCYMGKGTNAPYQRETMIEKLFRIFRWLIGYLRTEIKNR